MTDTSTEHATMSTPDTETKTVPCAYLVTRGTTVLTVHGVVDDNDPGDTKIAHWAIQNRSLNPLAWDTGGALLAEATWETGPEACAAAEQFAEAWEAMRTKAYEADDILRNLDLTGAQRPEPSPFPPGGEVIE